MSVIKYKVFFKYFEADYKKGLLYRKSNGKPVKAVEVEVGDHRVATKRIIYAMYHKKNLKRSEVVYQKDEDPQNNKIANLMLLTARELTYTSKVRKDSQNGFKGVAQKMPYQTGREWIARIKLMGKDKYLGSFHTPEDAHEAYKAAAYKYVGKFAKP